MNQPIKTYDYLIVGGGSAGCVLANRLSANPDIQVCLLEAGPADTNPFIRIPMGIIMVLRSKKLNWHYWTTPQPHCANRSMYWPRGKTLGGSSSINAMCYVRGNPQDYDHWAALGNTGWAYQDILSYFKKLEHFEPGPDANHGVGGPLHVAKPQYINPLMDAFIKAGKQAGYPILLDASSASQEGVGLFYVTEKNGQRCSNAQGYLHPIIKRNNLTVITNSHATRILFEGKRAIGVRYRQKKVEVDVFAKKDVILTAGSIGSPQLLLLSGIGPRADLEALRIPLIHDLPGVGANLQDHLDIHITCLDKTRTSLSFLPSAIWRHIASLSRYVWKKKGELTSNYTQAVGFVKSTAKQLLPDLQWHFAASMYTNSAQSLKPVFSQYGYLLMTCLLRPKSRGRVTLNSSDPMDRPLINPNYLAEDSDLEAMVAGFKKARDILSQSAFSSYFLKEFEPGDQVQTDEEIRQYIRLRSETIYHPVGTCKMGIDPLAVVDPWELKVYGIDNLRIVDASIMPTLPSGNTNTPTTMIAEKGADIILHSHVEK